jgi:hypothetical protein
MSSPTTGETDLSLAHGQQPVALTSRSQSWQHCGASGYTRFDLQHPHERRLVVLVERDDCENAEVLVSHGVGSSRNHCLGRLHPQYRQKSSGEDGLPRDGRQAGRPRGIGVG